ncbi:LPXTG cell wall anchor domain-containing protein [Agromyces albus]|uniref:LPXTG cell wall anchor domain-containing protein n=1 Tax=Agromyces albus TaxID=205332 RepID=A0A4Q2L6W7_9MICO|nr:LPXTG cell wall anchor domain-containing protein [Agromyces albus]RXZ72263.1 LPXTG cell wall anchor domain-containing protein [Agromyces albus]
MKHSRTLGAALILAGGAVVFSAAPAYAAIIPTDPPEGASDQICEDLDSGKSTEGGLGTTEEIFAPEGMVITLVCVKSGDDVSGGGPEYYLVDPPTNSVIIAHSTGKDISHYSFAFEAAPTPEPTPTPTPTPEPTPPPTVPPAGDKLAETGFESGWLPFVGIGALALGAALFVPRLVAKRR